MKKLNVVCYADKTPSAKKAQNALQNQYNFVCQDKVCDKVDAIIALGGDGFMLHTLHNFMHLNIPFFGMNCGSVGFLLNEFHPDNLDERLKKARKATLYPLSMKATDSKNVCHEALAINEVSLLRESRQTAKIAISVDHQIQMSELMCDGMLVSTAAGSTAYNISVGGTVIPLDSDLLAVTPISPFRPRRWRGAVLPHTCHIRLDVLDPKKRPVSAVADFFEVRDVVSVEIQEAREKPLTLLFDPDHSLEERIIKEQFMI